MSDTHAPPPEAPKPSTKPGAVVIGFLVFLVGEVIILANSGIKMPTILPEAISSYAEEVDNLYYVILWIVGFFFVLTEGLLVYFIVKYRARKDGRAVHTHGSHTLELAWTFIPGLILFCLAVFQTGTWGMIKFKGEMPKETDPDVIVVQVFGKQFEWNFRYPGADGKFGTEDDIITRSILHVPTGRDVIVHLQTQDVLHSFWLPNVRLKQDLLPGQTIKQWFHIEEGKTGKWPIVCAELCGNFHTTMKGTLIAETSEQFAAWLKEAGAEGASTRQGDPRDDALWKNWRENR